MAKFVFQNLDFQTRVFTEGDPPLAGNGGQRLAQPDDAPVQNASTDEPPRWLLW